MKSKLLFQNDGSSSGNAILTSSLAILALVAFAFALQSAAAVLIPLAFAVFINLLLGPLVDLAQRIHVPRVVPALLIVLVIPVSLGLGASLVSEPASRWLNEAPRVFERIKHDMGELSAPINDVQKAADAVKDMAELGKSSRPVAEVRVQPPGIVEELAGLAPNLAGGLILTMFLSFFLLCRKGTFLRRIARLAEDFSGKRRVVVVAREVQGQVRRFVITITLVNSCLGLLTFLYLYALGIEDALFWGIAAALVNYAPYIGPAVLAALMTFAGLATFDALGQALLMPLGYVVLTAIEGNLVTPTVLGQRFAIPPVLVLTGVVVGALLWGFAGALLAIPLLVSFKVAAANLPALRPMAVLLSR